MTGKKSDPIRLEQYKTKCPVHDVEFKQDLFCEKCKHKWPPQNYISTNNGGKFWLDGFMAEDGVVRQWIFTEEEAKGIAAQMIKQERVFAIGIAFYLSKQPKPVAPRNVTRGYTCDKIDWLTPQQGAAKYPGLYSSDAAGIAKGGTCSYSSKISAIPDWSVTDSTTISNTASDGGSTTCSVNGVSGFPGIAVAGGGPQGPTGPAGITGPQGPSGKTLEKEEKTSGGIPRPVKKLSGAPAGARRRTRGGPSGQSLGGRGDYEMPEVRGRVVQDQDIMSRFSDFENLASVEAEEISPIKESEVKKLEVGAGAKIDQKIFADPQSLDFWEQEPAGFIYINYCDEETAKKIIAAGKREESTEGFLDGLTLAK